MYVQRVKTHLLVYSYGNDNGSCKRYLAVSCNRLRIMEYGLYVNIVKNQNELLQLCSMSLYSFAKMPSRKYNAEVLLSCQLKQATHQINSFPPRITYKMNVSDEQARVYNGLLSLQQRRATETIPFAEILYIGHTSIFSPRKQLKFWRNAEINDLMFSNRLAVEPEV